MAYIPPIALRDKHLIFLDLETTGTNVTKNGICSFAAIRVHPVSMEILTSYESLVKPFDGCEISDDAMKINNIAISDLENAPSEQEVLSDFLQGSKDCIILGFNISFDMRFINKALVRHNLDTTNLPYHSIDVMSLCWPLVAGGHITSISLQSVCAYLNVINKGQHDAMADVIRTFKVFKKMMARFK